MQLKVDHTTVRRRIDALEQALDARLFEPRDRGFFLTPAGESLMSTAEAIESLAMSGEATVAGQNTTLSGAVRIGAPDGLGERGWRAFRPRPGRRGIRCEQPGAVPLGSGAGREAAAGPCL